MIRAGRSGSLLIAAAKILKKKTKATILVGTGGIDYGISMELIENGKWSLNVYSGKERIGIGISRDIYKNWIEIDMGIFVDKKYNDLFSKNLNVSIGLSGRF